MTHNKYFFSGRLESVRKTPEGGNVPQEYVPEDGTVPEGPHEKDVVELASNTDPFGGRAYNINPMLLEAIRMGDQFWTMAEQTKFTDVVDTIYYEVHYCTPWVPGTHKAAKASGMQSNIRGVSNAGTPGVAYTILLKLFIMQLTKPQVKFLLSHTDSPFIRCIGFLYLRIGLKAYEEIWDYYAPHLADKEEFNIDGTPATKTTIGAFARRLLTDQDYFGDRLPRIPRKAEIILEAHIKEYDAAKMQMAGMGSPAMAPQAAAPPPPPLAPPPPPPSKPSPSSGLDERRREREALRERDERRRDSPQRSEDESPRKARAEKDKEKDREKEKEREREKVEKEKEREKVVMVKKRLKRKRSELATLTVKVKSMRRKIADAIEAE